MKGVKNDEDAGLAAAILSKVAIDLINTKQYTHLKSYLLLIERFLVSKHHIAKSSLKNSFIPALFLFIENRRWKREVLALFPPDLYKMYCEHAHAKEIPVQNDLKEFIIHLN